MVVRINNNLWRNTISHIRKIQTCECRTAGKVLGLCDNNIRQYFIADNQSDYKTEHILCHEVHPRNML